MGQIALSQSSYGFQNERHPRFIVSAQNCGPVSSNLRLRSDNPDPFRGCNGVKVGIEHNWRDIDSPFEAGENIAASSTEFLAGIVNGNFFSTESLQPFGDELANFRFVFAPTFYVHELQEQINHPLPIDERLVLRCKDQRQDKQNK